MKIRKTIYHTNLVSPDWYEVECGFYRMSFNLGEEKKIGDWIKSVWEEEFFPSEAKVYYFYGLDESRPLYCKYEFVA